MSRYGPSSSNQLLRECIYRPITRDQASEKGLIFEGDAPWKIRLSLVRSTRATGYTS